MKTELTKKIEYLIFKDTTKLGISGCREVKIGTHKTKSLLTGEQEFVDYMTITSDGEITQPRSEEGPRFQSGDEFAKTAALTN